MKKGSIILLAVVTILLGYGCKDDDDNSASNFDQIIGTWVLEESIMTECDSSALNGNTSFACTSSNCTKYTFLVDTVVTQRDSVVINVFDISRTVNGQSSGESGTFSVGHDNIALCQQDEEEPEVCISYALSINAESMTIIQKDNETGCKETLVFTKEE